MARIRSIKPEFWKDEELAVLPRDIRLFYIGLWNEADDHGRCRGNSAYLKGQIFPYDKDFNIRAALDSLEQLNKIQLYESEKGEQLLVVRQFYRHQKIDKRYASKLPAPPPYKKKAVRNQVRIDLAVRQGAAWPSKKVVKAECEACGSPGTVYWMTKRWVMFRGLEIDHKVPESVGGSGLTSNMQLLCRPCNRKKADTLPEIPADQPAEPPDCPPKEQGTGIREQGSGGKSADGRAPKGGTPVSPLWKGRPGGRPPSPRVRRKEPSPECLVCGDLGTYDLGGKKVKCTDCPKDKKA